MSIETTPTANAANTPKQKQRKLSNRETFTLRDDTSVMLATENGNGRIAIVKGSNGRRGSVVGLNDVAAIAELCIQHRESGLPLDALERQWLDSASYLRDLENAGRITLAQRMQLHNAIAGAHQSACEEAKAGLAAKRSALERQLAELGNIA
jgi:hypothetical protein